MDAATSVERQLYILSLLAQSKNGYTLQQIIDHLQRVGIDATRRMVTRDMDSISRDFYVYEDEMDGKTVFKADKYAVSNMDFTMPQIISMYYLKELLGENSSFNLASEAAGILDDILGQMPKLSQAALSEVERMIKVVPLSAGEKDLDENILEDVRRAARECKGIELEYNTFSTGELTKRLFDPYVLEVREGCWHAIGYCHLRNSVRDLRVSRIRSTKLTEHGFEVPRGFYEDYSTTRFDKLAGEQVYDICVCFTGQAARLVGEYHSAKADKLEDTEAGVLFKKRAAITPDLVAWLLQFGAEAKVEAPGELRKMVLNEAKKMIGIYEG